MKNKIALQKNIKSHRNYKKVRTHTKSHYKTHSSKIRSRVLSKSRAVKQNQCVDKGFGFRGISLKKISDVIERVNSNQPNIQEYRTVVKPIIDIGAGKLSEFFNFAVGDFTGSELQSLDDLLCNVVPYEPDALIGTLALKLTNLPCPAGTTVAVCFNFSRCGSFSLAFNGGIPACIATLTGVGALIAPILNTIAHVGFGFSVNNRIIQSYNINVYDKEKNSLIDKSATVKGNLYFTLGISLGEAIFPASFSIGGKKLSEIFDISGSVNVIIDFGKKFTNKDGVIDQARQGTKDNSKSTIKGFINSGAEFAFALKSVLSFKLSSFTSNFLPDINVSQVEFNMLASQGGGYSEVSKGVYFSLSATISLLTSFYQAFRATIGKIIEFFGVKFPDLNLDIGVKVAVAIQDEVFGIILAGNFGPIGQNITCLYKYSEKVLSCNGQKVDPFTIIIEGVQWVVKRVKTFFENVGNGIRVAFDNAKKWVITNIVDPLDKFFKGQSRIPSACPEGKENSVGLCYNKCQPGYKGLMGVCTSDCPSGFRDDGLFCYKPPGYDRGRPYSMFDGNKCKQQNPQGCDNLVVAWIPKCRPGFHYFPANFCTPNCPPGMNDLAATCGKKAIFRGLGSLPICAPDEDNILGLCFKKNPNRNYYKQYLKRMRFKLRHRKFKLKN